MMAFICQAVAPDTGRSMAPWADDLRELRLRSGLSQADLSTAMGISQSYVSRLERGERQFEVAEAAAWAGACHARLALVREGEDLGMLEEGERRLVEGIRELGPGQRGLVEQLVDVLPRLEPQSLAMLAALLDVAARGVSSSSADGKAAEGG